MHQLDTCRHHIRRQVCVQVSQVDLHFGNASQACGIDSILSSCWWASPAPWTTVFQKTCPDAVTAAVWMRRNTASQKLVSSTCGSVHLIGAGMWHWFRFSISDQLRSLKTLVLSGNFPHLVLVSFLKWLSTYCQVEDTGTVWQLSSLFLPKVQGEC